VLAFSASNNGEPVLLLSVFQKFTQSYACMPSTAIITNAELYEIPDPWLRKKECDSIEIESIKFTRD